MTKGEAIRIISGEVLGTTEQTNEAVAMAVEALSAQSQQVTGKLDSDCISRQAAIDALADMYRAAEKWGQEADDDVIKAKAESCMASLVEMKLRIEKLPSVQPKPLTDEEQRIFLRAMEREEKVCKHVDNVYNNSYEDSLVRTCHEITRKVKGALWTI